MGKIINSSATGGTRINFFGAKVQSDESWLEALPVDIIRGTSRYSGRTTDGVWVSAGASYGAQVEFKSFDAANAFIDKHSSTSRPAQGTSRPRVTCDNKPTFVAAYEAAAGKESKVRATTNAIVAGEVEDEDLELLAMAEQAKVEAEKAVSPRDRDEAKLRAKGFSDEVISRVLAQRYGA